MTVESITIQEVLSKSTFSGKDTKIPNSLLFAGRESGAHFRLHNYSITLQKSSRVVDAVVDEQPRASNSKKLEYEERLLW